jgi:hypothetical protein
MDSLRGDPCFEKSSPEKEPPSQTVFLNRKFSPTASTRTKTGGMTVFAGLLCKDLCKNGNISGRSNARAAKS